MKTVKVSTADRGCLLWSNSKVDALLAESFLANYEVYKGENEEDALFFLYNDTHEVIDFVYLYKWNGVWEVCSYVWPNKLPHPQLIADLGLEMYGASTKMVVPFNPAEPVKPHKSLVRAERKCSQFTVKPATWKEFDELKQQWVTWFKEKFGREPNCHEVEHQQYLEVYEKAGLYDMFGVYDKEKCIAVSGFYKAWEQSYYYAYTYWNPDYRTYGLGLYSIMLGHKEANKKQLHFDLGLLETQDGVRFEFKEMWSPTHVKQDWVKLKEIKWKM